MLKFDVVTSSKTMLYLLRSYFLLNVEQHVDGVYLISSFVMINYWSYPHEILYGVNSKHA
jgi:hypothetical protein